METIKMRFGIYMTILGFLRSEEFSDVDSAEKFAKGLGFSYKIVDLEEWSVAK